MQTLKRILLVEDDPRDIELTLAALAEHNLANKVAVVRDQHRLRILVVLGNPIPYVRLAS